MSSDRSPCVVSLSLLGPLVLDEELSSVLIRPTSPLLVFANVVEELEIKAVDQLVSTANEWTGTHIDDDVEATESPCTRLGAVLADPYCLFAGRCGRRELEIKTKP